MRKVSFQLRKANAAEETTGLLLLSEDPADVLALCARLSASAGRPETRSETSRDFCRAIHAVPGGFLVRLSQPATTVHFGALRLREFAVNLYLPVDANLSPALFDDEASALGRDRRLVFLPGGQVVAFDPSKPLAWSALVQARRVSRGGWQALPERPALADRVRDILLDRPQDEPEIIVEGGGAGIAEETPQPPANGAGSNLTGHLLSGLGLSLSWVGNLVGWRNLAHLGAGMAQSGLRRIVRYSESLLGQQEAVLRDLLRDFREGNIDKALRRALPISQETDRGNAVASDAQLPTHDPRYSLGSVLASGRGPVGLWMGGAELQVQLTAEYRKAAEAATARGDYRRAAFIYGRLLNEYRLAADVLSRGGLHHDAAILYLHKVGDNMAAARAFEAAGEIDRAVKLYRQCGAFVQSGDLLRKVGEDDLAVRDYLAAAGALENTGQYLAAGELLLDKTGQVNLALKPLRRGWGLRPEGNALACLKRLAQFYAEQETPKALQTLVAEADHFFAQTGADHDVGSFYNQLAHLAELPNLAAVRDQLRDTALLAVAGRLRERAALGFRRGSLVSTLFGQSGAWGPDVVSDADAAFIAATRLKAARAPSVSRDLVRLTLGSGLVVAACAAQETGRLFVALSTRQIVGFNPEDGTMISPAVYAPVDQLAADEAGEMLLARHGNGGKMISGFDYRARLAFPQQTCERMIEMESPRLTYVTHDGGEPVVGVWNDTSLKLLKGWHLVPEATLEGSQYPEAFAPCSAVLTRTSISPGNHCWGALLFSAGAVAWCPFRGTARAPASLGWMAAPQQQALCSELVRTLETSNGCEVELLRLGEPGNLFWSRLSLHGHECERIGDAVSVGARYLAATMLLPRQFAGVHKDGVDWLRLDGRQLVVWTRTTVHLGNAVACFFSPLTMEMLVLCGDGTLVRVPVPQ
jgi:tetratricopeptide (TPR) repeat protein